MKNLILVFLFLIVLSRCCILDDIQQTDWSSSDYDVPYVVRVDTVYYVKDMLQLFEEYNEFCETHYDTNVSTYYYYGEILNPADYFLVPHEYCSCTDSPLSGFMNWYLENK